MSKNPDISFIENDSYFGNIIGGTIIQSEYIESIESKTISHPHFTLVAFLRTLALSP